MLTLELDDIISEGNVRVETGDVSSLATSIDRHGLVQPIIVSKTDPDAQDGTYTLIAGHRRVAAVRELGWTGIQAVVSDIISTATDVISTQYAENTQRVDLTDWEKAQAAWDLKLEGLKQAEVAASMGVTKGDVSKMHKIVKALTKDEALDGTVAGQFDFDGLLEIAESPIPEHSMDVMLRIVNGEDRWTHAAIRAVESEVKTVTFYEENSEQLADWSEAGVQITHTDPHHAWGKTTSYGPKDDPKVATLDDIGITVAKHIKLNCHMVWLRDKWGDIGFIHYCMDRRTHADKGKSDVKAKNQEVVVAKGADPKASAERASEKAAKDLRRAKAAKWMASRYTKADMYQLMLYSSLSGDGWKEDHIRAATWMLGLNSERPKGADYSWYQNRLKKYLDDEFGPLEGGDKRREWKVRMVHARRYIDASWPIDMVKEQIEAQEVADEGKKD
jgi:ParB/RepB/Spo0J family partition protein